MLELLTFFESEALHDLCHSIGRPKVAHQVVFEADIKPRRARVALSGATASQLSIDPARLMSFGADHHQAAQLGYAGTELNIWAPPRHVRGNRYRARLAGAPHDL